MKLRQCLRWWRAAPKCRPPRAATPDWVTAGTATPAPAPPEAPLGWWLDWQGGPPQAVVQGWAERLGRPG